LLTLLWLNKVHSAQSMEKINVMVINDTYYQKCYKIVNKFSVSLSSYGN